MSKKNHHHDEGAELHFEQVSHHGVRYENRDLGGRSIMAFLIVLMISGFTICLVVWGYFSYHEKHMESAPPLSATAPVPVSNASAEQLQRYRTAHNPTVPLQVDDVSDMNSFRKKSDDTLNSYGWVDQKSGAVHIPIDQAMKTIAQQGLPTRPAQQMSPAADFGSGSDTVAGAAGGTRPETRQ